MYIRDRQPRSFWFFDSPMKMVTLTMVLFLGLTAGALAMTTDHTNCADVCCPTNGAVRADGAGAAEGAEGSGEALDVGARERPFPGRVGVVAVFVGPPLQLGDEGPHVVDREVREHGLPSEEALEQFEALLVPANGSRRLVGRAVEERERYAELRERDLLLVHLGPALLPGHGR